MKTKTSRAALVAALIVAGCAPAVDPFRISADEFRRRVKTVAVARVLVPSSLGADAAAGTKFHSALEDKLRQAGFTVVLAQHVGEIREAKERELGGLFDPQTGKLDEAKLATLVSFVRGEVKTRFGADALLLSHVRTVTANFAYLPLAGVRAKWDGATESLETGSVDKVLSPRVNGTVDALSLLVTVEDINGSSLYAYAGGIQVLFKLAPGAGQFGGKSFVPVPKAELLADQERIQQAVSYALGPSSKASDRPHLTAVRAARLSRASSSRHEIETPSCPS
jgi:hypothetical protein